MTLVLVLAGCAGDRPPLGEVGNVEGFVGGVAAEEPRAALIARDALSAGGSAADAAVAAFFAMSVTYPAAVGLGGGGLCLYYDSASDKATTLDFRSEAPAAGGPYAVPGALRGMAVLHARYGRLPWQQVITPAETIARFGEPVSRALAHRIEAESERIAGSPGLADLFLQAGGAPKPEGRMLQQVALSATLARLRSRGVGDFYGGALGQRFVDGAAEAGGAITIDDLRDYRATWHDTRQLSTGGLTVHTPEAPAAGAVLHALLQQALDGEGTSGGAALAAAAPVPAESADGDGEAALVVGDNSGSAAACLFTMGRDFGAAAMARTAGILLAPVEAAAGTFASPVLAVDHDADQAALALAASGGPAAPAATAQVAAALLADDKTLEEALSAPRAVRLGAAGPLLREDADTEVAQAGDAAFSTAPRTVIGRVQALWCEDGLERAPDSCAIRSDRRGYGLAAGGFF